MKHCICGIEIKPECTYCISCWKKIRYADLRSARSLQADPYYPPDYGLPEKVKGAK